MRRRFRCSRLIKETIYLKLSLNKRLEIYYYEKKNNTKNLKNY